MSCIWYTSKSSLFCASVPWALISSWDFLVFKFRSSKRKKHFSQQTLCLGKIHSRLKLLQNFPPEWHITFFCFQRTRDKKKYPGQVYEMLSCTWEQNFPTIEWHCFTTSSIPIHSELCSSAGDFQEQMKNPQVFLSTFRRYHMSALVVNLKSGNTVGHAWLPSGNMQ